MLILDYLFIFLSTAPTAQNSPELKIHIRYLCLLRSRQYSYSVTECQRNMTIPFLCVMATFLPFFLLSNLSRNIKVNKKLVLCPEFLSPYPFYFFYRIPKISLKLCMYYVVWSDFLSFQIFFCNGIITFHLPGRIKPVIVTLVKVKKKNYIYNTLSKCQLISKYLFGGVRV